MRWCLFALLAFAHAATSAGEAAAEVAERSGPRPFLRVESINFGGPVAVREALDDMRASGVGTGEAAFTHSEAEAGIRWREYTLSAFYRQDWYLRFSEDLAELAFRQVNDVPVPAGRVYDLQLGADQLEGWGVRIARRFSLSDRLRVGARVSLLRTIAMLDGSAEGQVAVADGDYEGRVEVAQRYTTDYLLDRPVAGPEGWGGTLDLAVEYEASDRLRIAVELEDALSHLRWEELPRTVASIESRTASLDENGNLLVRPVLSGIEDFDDHVQELPRRLDLRASYQLRARRTLWARHLRIAGDPFTRLGVTVAPRRGPALSLGADIDARALLVGLSGRRWRVDLGIDAFAPDDASLIDLTIGLGL